MRILTVVQPRDASPGVFAEIAAAEGHEPGEWTPAEAPPPTDLGDYDAALVLLRSVRPARSNPLSPTSLAVIAAGA